MDINSITKPEWIAIFVSIASALFTFYTWRESKQANSISKHPMQLEIYDAYNDLVLHTKINGLGLNQAEVAKFYRYLKKAKFYFNKDFSNQIEHYFKICAELANLNRRYIRDIGKGNNELINNIEIEQDKLDDEMMRLEENIENNFIKVLKI